MIKENVKLVFVTPSCNHYRLKLFEELSKELNIEFLFFLDDKLWRMAKMKDQLLMGNFTGYYLPGFYITSQIRVVPKLAIKLLQGAYDTIICDNTSFISALLGTFLIAKLLRKNLILFSELWMNPDTLFHKYTFHIRKFIYRKSDAIVVCGEHVKKYLLNLGVKEEKIFIGWNTLDNTLFNKIISQEEKLKLRKNLGLKDKRIILSVGRLVEEKGLIYLLNAYKILQKKHNTALLLIGDGAKKDFLKNEVKRLSLENIIFMDYIMNKELCQYYSIADVFVLPSITIKTWKEPWGFVINEAMNQGCPVVATNAVGAAMGGLVDDGETGFIVPEKNSDKLANAIDKILSNTTLQNDMKKNSIRKIQNWNSDFQSQGFFKAIEYVINKEKYK